MRAEDRKAAAEAFRERKPDPGIFVVRCATTGEAWVGAAPGLGAIENRMRFIFSNGGGSWPAIAASARANSADAMRFEALERLDPEAPDYLGARTLRAAAERWAAELGAILI